MKGWLVKGRVPAPSTDRPAAPRVNVADRPGPIRQWLDVTFAEKNAAKAAGARWDGEARRWYAPRPGMAGLARWLARPPLPDLLPGEDRSFGSGRLAVEPVPASCWFTNVRSGVAPAEWDRVRRMVYDRAADRCEMCGRGRDRAAGIQMEAHEFWDYDDARGVQVLRRLICLCGGADVGCHGSIHWGLANVQGRTEGALAHLMRVTGMTRDLAAAHVEAAFEVWEARSARTWDLDLSILTSAGVELAQSVSPARRAEIAAERLAAGR